MSYKKKLNRENIIFLIMIGLTELSKQILRYFGGNKNDIPPDNVITEDSNIGGKVTALSLRFPFEIGNIRFKGMIDTGAQSVDALVHYEDFQKLVEGGYIANVRDRRINGAGGVPLSSYVEGRGNVSFYDDNGNPHMIPNLRIGAFTDSSYRGIEILGLQFLKGFSKLEFYMEGFDYIFKARIRSK
jgi:hypothetical protein